MNSSALFPSQLLAPLHFLSSPDPVQQSTFLASPALVHLSMEGFLASRALGEESLQMWDLNKRLEAYLARVKFLEEENELLRAEIQRAKDSPAESSWRCKYEEELSSLRATLDDAFREKYAAELARDNLYEEIQQVKSSCQKERAAQEEAKKQLAMSKKELEEEKRAQIWLKERAAQLEKEVETLVEVHEEEKAGLDQEIASFSQSLENFRTGPVAFQPVEVEDYSKRLSEIWRGAVETYKSEVSQLESSFCQAKENLWKAVEGNRQNQLQLQQLEKELAGLKVRKGMLEESLSRQWQDQRGEAEKFQLALESLEQEKQALRVQIAHVLEERQQLMHLKMSLSLEVATYRTLLEAESSRLQMPSAEYKLINGFRDAKLEVSNSKLQVMTPESRRLVLWDHWSSPTAFRKVESKRQLLKNQNDSPRWQAAAIGLPTSDGPVAREFQKINSVLQSPLMKSAHAVRAAAAPDNSIAITPGSALSDETIKAANIETVAQSFSQEPFETELDILHSTGLESRPSGWSNSDSECRSLAIEGGDETVSPGEAGEMDKEGKYLEEAKTEVKEDPSKEPPGELAPKESLCPSQIVSEALEGALKDVIDHTEPTVDSNFLEADRIPNDALSYDSSPLEEAPRLAASPTMEVLEEGNMAECEGQTEAEQLMAAKDTEATDEMDSGLKPHLEEGTREAEMQEFQDTEWSQTSTKQNEESIPDDLANEGGSEIETQEEVRSWEQNENEEEESSRLQSTEMCGVSDVVCKSTESGSPLDEGGLVSLEAERKSWEAGISGHSNLAAEEGYLGEFDQREDDLERVSTEALDVSEDEERQELLCPSKENEERNLQIEMQESEFLQREIQATEAFLMESHPLVPLENHPALMVESCQEQHFSGSETEKFEQQETLLPETDATLQEEGRKEIFFEPEHLSLFRDGAVSRAEENTLQEKTVDITRESSEGHKGKPGMETLEHEDPTTDEDDLRDENLDQENDILEKKVADPQENNFEQDIMLGHEDLENVQRQESLGREEEAEEDYQRCDLENVQKQESLGREEEAEEHYQRCLLKEQEREGKEIAVTYPEVREAADMALQEPARADTLMTSTGVPESECEQIKSSLGAEMEEIMGDEEEYADNFIGQEHPMPHSKAEQEDSPSPELIEKDQCSSKIEHGDIQSQPALQLGISPSHEIRDEAIKPLEEPWETPMKVDDEDETGEELCDEPENPEHINMASKVYHQAQGDSSGSEDSLESMEDISPNDSQKMEGVEEELTSSRRIALEETLPDSTPLHFYEKEVLARTTSTQEPPASDSAGGSASAPEGTVVFPEEVGQLESRTQPTSPQMKENSEEGEPGMALAGTAEGLEEEEGYFMVSAPSQETPGGEEATVPDGFEGIQAETSTFPREDPGMHMELSDVPRDERLFDAGLEEEDEETVLRENDAGKGSEAREFLLEESEPHSSDFSWEPEKDDVFPVKGSDGSCIPSSVLTEGDSAADQELEDTQKDSPLTSMADLGQILLEEILPSDNQKGSSDSSSPLSSEDEESPNVTQAQQGSDPEISRGVDPGQPKDATETNQSSVDHSVEMVAKIPEDVMRDSDILEIVEQALEFNQELMLGARLLELRTEDEQAPAGVEVSDQTQEVGSEGSNLSTALPGVNESGALEETLTDSPLHAKELMTSSLIWTEKSTNGELNGLHKEQELNGISDLQPLTEQNDSAKSRGREVNSSEDEFFGKVTITQEFHGEEPETFPISAATLSQSPSQTPAYDEGCKAGEEHSKKGQVSDESDDSKFTDIMKSVHVQSLDIEAQPVSVPPPFGDHVIHLGHNQNLKFQLTDDQESWSSEDD